MHKVLLMEDDRDLLNTLTDFLQDVGYEVVAAENGREGMKIIYSQPDDAPIKGVVTDVKMPFYDGFDVIVELKRTRPKMPVIALTGGGDYRGVDIETELARLDITGYYIKPTSMLPLVAKLNAAIEKNDQEAAEEAANNAG
jgi:DNA-binding response OmpR family regulator